MAAGKHAPWCDLAVVGSAEMGGFWDRRDDVSFHDLHPAGSIFVAMGTIFGPIFIGYGRTEENVDSFYLRFGTLLRTETEF